MASNEILPFCETDTGDNLLSQAVYSTFLQRTIGNQPGIADDRLVNKALKQSTLIAAGLAKYLADNQSQDVTDDLTVDEIASLIGNTIVTGIRYYPSGSTLPTTDIGPIWHDDYNSIMTWQAFTANGAAYTGYASVLVGNLLLDTQPTPRTGYVKSGTINLNRSTYAALRGWAMHNGIMVASGVWAAGQIAVCDNGDGTTFRIFDIRGEFPRFWDDGRGADSGRAFGSWQTDLLKAHDHPGGTSPYTGGYVNASGTGPDGYNNVGSTGGAETRPRNVSLLGAVKF